MPATDSEPVRTTALLAQRLGISRWAVSRAINGRSGVSRTTVERVRKALIESNFEPDHSARALRGARSGTIGVAVPAFDHPLFLRGLGAMDQQWRSRGFHLELSTTGDCVKGEQQALRRFAARRVEGVVLFHSRLKEKLLNRGALNRTETPLLLAEPATQGRLGSLPIVLTDHSQAMELLVNHLHGFGHRRFALLGFTQNPLRLKGLRRAFERNQISWRENVWCIEPEPVNSGSTPPLKRGILPEGTSGRDTASRYVSGWTMGAKLLGQRAFPATAVIAVDDATAFGALRALREKGRSVPKDFSLVGYGNEPFGEFCDPPLTTVDPQFESVIARASELLWELLRAPGQIETSTLLINPLLLRRQSVGPTG